MDDADDNGDDDDICNDDENQYVANVPLPGQYSVTACVLCVVASYSIPCGKRLPPPCLNRAGVDGTTVPREAVECSRSLARAAQLTHSPRTTTRERCDDFEGKHRVLSIASSLSRPC